MFEGCRYSNKIELQPSFWHKFLNFQGPTSKDFKGTQTVKLEAISLRVLEKMADDSRRYFEKHNIHVYLSDSLSYVLSKRKDSKFHPMDALADYFKGVVSGSHVAFREYNYIILTPYNRRSFIKVFESCFKNLRAESFILKEYHSYLQLLCCDFPLTFLNDDIFNLFFADQNTKEKVPLAFTKFIRAFQVLFYYQPFFQKCKDAFDEMRNSGCMQVHSGPVVVVPTASASPRSPLSSTSYSPILGRKQGGSEVPSDGLESSLFQPLVAEVIRKMSANHPGEVYPQEEAVYSAINSKRTITFVDFVRILTNNPLLQFEGTD